ncbi:hypothetical protein QQF64_000177 [Cirrhinus molitorella]|uniref:Immunoglobulin domain-containing protein n=1 Tax=Cirrhinus molitorella TaxID=172907 RepID=A0ABR3NWS4_9TELE
MKIIWTFTLLMIPGVVNSISVTGYSGGGVIITCRYYEGYSANAKYFCRGQWSECTDRIRTNTKNKLVDDGRFSLYDDTRAAVFTVTIRDLSEQDSGMYYCGTDIYAKKDPYTEVNLNIIADEKIRTVNGYSGGNVIINYKFKTVEDSPLIDVCKMSADQCFTLINTNSAAEWKHNIRFSIHDDRSARLLHVFIRELDVNDSGKYRIIVKVSEDYSFFSEFNLDIRNADCCEKSISLSAAAGGSVNISCKYPQSHSADVKFVCRRSGSDLCAEETSVKESRRWSAEGQIQLYDDREQQLLTGTISHVTQQHSAEYWCGVQSDQGHKSFITRVRISVTEANSKTIYTSTSSLPSSSSSFSSAESPLITSVSPVTGSSLIIVVSALLLLIITVILIVILWRRRTHSSSNTSHTVPANSDAVSHYHCDYEEIQDNHRPTNPPDSSNTVYATPGLPTNSSDSTNTVYANSMITHKPL